MFGVLFWFSSIVCFVYDCMGACVVGEKFVGEIEEVGDPEEVFCSLQFNRRRI